MESDKTSLGEGDVAGGRGGGGSRTKCFSLHNVPFLQPESSGDDDATLCLSFSI